MIKHKKKAITKQIEFKLKLIYSIERQITWNLKQKNKILRHSNVTKTNCPFSKMKIRKQEWAKLNLHEYK